MVERLEGPSGHLFVIDGDLTKVRCDAVLIPTDSVLNVTRLWRGLLVEGWNERVRPRHARWTVIPDPATADQAEQIWFGNVGSISESAGAYVDVAEDFVVSSALSLRERDSAANRARPHLVALNVLGTGAGGMGDQRGTLIKSLVERLTSLAPTVGVDILLVTWGVKQYAAARRAQRLLRSTTSLSPVPEFVKRPDIAEAVEALSAESLLGRLVLFVGAGVSTGAGLPDWETLIEQLAASCPEPLDLDRLRAMDSRDQAQVLMTQLSEEVFRDRIVALLRTSRYGLSHGLLSSLDAREVVTTNYDVLLEEAYGTARRPAVLPQSPVGADGRWILKLHGTVDDPPSIVLARQDYMGLPERSAALFGIMQAMLMTKHMLFVGYSLTDDTFHRVMHDVRRARGDGAASIGTALTLFDDPLLRRLWGDVLHFVPMEPRPETVTEEDRVRAARLLEIVLDEIAIRSADISAFLLDPTYDGVLEDGERAIRAAAEALLEATGDDEHIGAAVREMLASLTTPDPKDGLSFEAAIRQAMTRKQSDAPGI